MFFCLHRGSIDRSREISGQGARKTRKPASDAAWRDRSPLNQTTVDGAERRSGEEFVKFPSHNRVHLSGLGIRRRRTKQTRPSRTPSATVSPSGSRPFFCLVRCPWGLLARMRCGYLCCIHRRGNAHCQPRSALFHSPGTSAYILPCGRPTGHATRRPVGQGTAGCRAQLARLTEALADDNPGAPFD